MVASDARDSLVSTYEVTKSFERPPTKRRFLSSRAQNNNHPVRALSFERTYTSYLPRFLLVKRDL